MSQFARTNHNQVRRLPDRARYDKQTIYRIIDEALYCHVSFAEEGRPFIIPTIHARLGDTLILHGAKASRLLKQVESGAPLCVAITLLDGLVFARSVFHHSMNYRSVVIFGAGRAIQGDEEKLRALEALTEHVAHGRWADVRKPSQRELNATSVVAIDIQHASAKLRSGPPSDDEEDYALPVWAGVLPMQQGAGAPIDDLRLVSGISAPEYIVGYSRSPELAGQEKGGQEDG